MNRYYYFTAMVFTKNGETEYLRGEASSEDGEFPLSYTTEGLAKHFNVDTENVNITFYHEISKQEYDNLTGN